MSSSSTSENTSAVVSVEQRARARACVCACVCVCVACQQKFNSPRRLAAHTATAGHGTRSAKVLPVDLRELKKQLRVWIKRAQHIRLCCRWLQPQLSLRTVCFKHKTHPASCLSLDKHRSGINWLPRTIQGTGGYGTPSKYASRPQRGWPRDLNQARAGRSTRQPSQYSARHTYNSGHCHCGVNTIQLQPSTANSRLGKSAWQPLKYTITTLLCTLTTSCPESFPETNAGGGLRGHQHDQDLVVAAELSSL